VGPRAGLDICGKSRPPTGIRSPDLPARGESLYRLNYTWKTVLITYSESVSITLFMKHAKRMRYVTQGVPLANEPGISLIILTPMKILQRNLNRSTFVV
jgi:hypothetical protein